MKKLLFTCSFILISLYISAQNTAEEAIKGICKKESEAFQMRDLPVVLSCQADVDYSSRYWPENAYNSSEALRKAYTLFIKDSPQPTGKTVKQSNRQLKAMGDNYFWATYDQALTATGGKTSSSKEARLLEKINGE